MFTVLDSAQCSSLQIFLPAQVEENNCPPQLLSRCIKLSNIQTHQVRLDLWHDLGIGINNS